ncbi:MAG: glycosyltransferase [Cyanobium sp. M30B3]|jgi:colanic acid/amylovoran biosynthesis glycosyltransferase|nr:MAG: glycosyltransferase [Cyanobium sp. M30B3]
MAPSLSPLRIGIATSRFPRRSETFVLRHVRLLGGGRTVVVCWRQCDRAEGPERPLFSRWAALRACPSDLLLSPWHLWRNWRRYRSPLVPYGQNRQQLLAFLRDQSVDVILAEFGSQAVLLWPLARQLGVPLFSYFRGRDASKYLRSRWRLSGYRRMMPQLAGVFCVSSYLARNLAGVGLVHPNLHVIPSGVDTEQFRPADKKPGMIVFAGRFVEKKSPLLVIQSFLRLSARHPHASLHLVGQGPLHRACRRLAARSSACGRIVFHGWQSHGQLRDLLATADIFALHAVTGQDGETEGMPSVIQEAMACGAAILSSRHAGIPDVVEHGRSGYLVAERDLAGTVEALDALLSDPVGTRCMGEHARVVAEAELDFRNLYQRVEEVMAQAVASDGRIQTF